MKAYYKTTGIFYFLFNNTCDFVISYTKLFCIRDKFQELLKRWNGKISAYRGIDFRVGNVLKHYLPKFQILKLKGDKIKIYIDGSGFNGKESRACITNEVGRVVETIRTNEEKTNNQMEYQALFIALMNYAKEGDEILTDSQLLVGQCTKNWKINVEHLRLVIHECKKLLEAKKIKLTWVSRENNLAGRILEKG